MKRVDKEITGKDRIQRELAANGRKKIQKETAGIIENKEIAIKENAPQKTEEGEDKAKMPSGQKTDSGEEEAADENAENPDMLTGGINAIDMENLAESAETDSPGQNLCSIKCKDSILTDGYAAGKSADNGKEDAFGGRQAQETASDGRKTDIFSCRQMQGKITEEQKGDTFSGSQAQRANAENQKPDTFPGSRTQRQNMQRILADKQEAGRAKAPNAETDSLQTGVISDMEAILKEGKEEELRDLMEWFFKENIRMEMLQKEISERQEELEKEKKQFAEYVKSKEYSMEMDQKRLEKENRFFDQKMQILQGGFKQLEEDRRNFQKEQDKFKASKEAYTETQDAFKRYETTEMLFRGVNSFLALKKRYKDLIKVFHPDNVAGDHEMVQLINREYEELKKAYEVGMQA